MNDWHTRINMSRRDGLKAAGIILGMLLALIFAGWLLSRFARHEPPPLQSPMPPAPAAPAR